MKKEGGKHREESTKERERIYEQAFLVLDNATEEASAQLEAELGHWAKVPGDEEESLFPTTSYEEWLTLSTAFEKFLEGEGRALAQELFVLASYSVENMRNNAECRARTYTLLRVLRPLFHELPRIAHTVAKFTRKHPGEIMSLPKHHQVELDWLKIIGWAVVVFGTIYISVH